MSTTDNEQRNTDEINEEQEIQIKTEDDISLSEDLSEAASVFGEVYPDQPAEAGDPSELKLQIEQLQTRNDQLMRVAADFENYKRRNAREREDLIKFAGQQIVTNLLDVIDNIERAIQNEIKPEEFPNFVEGVKMIHKQFLDVLQKAGVSVIEAVGQPFNPEYHEAIMSESTNDYPDETVVAEFQKGYQMNGRVLRASMVKVSKEA
ncbi:MAG: nucleotide exchange factor GrpE [Candidatus Sericytochromatia bacterium]|nr:nucleotide exchange factor GrpE [Candidatus Sericytochromatia bacterium]